MQHEDNKMLNIVNFKWQWTSYQIRKIAGCACAENARNVSPRRLFQRKPLVSDSGMHHGTCVTHVPWCMSGSLTCGDGENVPGIPGACAPAILRILSFVTHPCNDTSQQNIAYHCSDNSLAYIWVLLWLEYFSSCHYWISYIGRGWKIVPMVDGSDPPGHRGHALP